jgi:hypothetical protein
MLNAKVEFLVTPYSYVGDDCFPGRILKELLGGRWDYLRIAVAFARNELSHGPLLDAMRAFSSGGRRIDITFGADRFTNSQFGTDYAAVVEVLKHLDSSEGVRISLYHETGRTFHPKIYMFSNELEDRALVIIGSSNWTEGGFFRNIEANMTALLDLSVSSAREAYSQLVDFFEQFWQDSNENLPGHGFARRVTSETIAQYQPFLAPEGSQLGVSSPGAPASSSRASEENTSFRGVRYSSVQPWRPLAVNQPAPSPFTSTPQLPTTNIVSATSPRGPLVWSKKLSRTDAQQQQGKSYR